MSPPHHAFESLRRAHLAVVDALREVLVEAGVPEVQVHTRFSPEVRSAPHLVVLPFQVRPFPKLAEVKDDFALMGAAPERRVPAPEPWLRLGAWLTELVQTTFAAADPKGRSRSTAPIAALPAPLAAWYATQAGTGEGWVTDGIAHAPSLMWHRSLPIEAQYLVFASDHPLPPREGESVPVSFGLPALAAVYLGLHEQSAITVRLPQHTVAPAVLSFLEAWRAVAPAERAAELASFVAWTRDDPLRSLALLPVPEVNGPQFEQILRANASPGAVVGVFSIQILVGGGPVFGPSGAPTISTTQRER